MGTEPIFIDLDSNLNELSSIGQLSNGIGTHLCPKPGLGIHRPFQASCPHLPARGAHWKNRDNQWGVWLGTHPSTRGIFCGGGYPSFDRSSLM